MDKRNWGKVRITERDVEILQTLYEMRTLTVEQIRELFFDSKSYTYLRLHQLKKGGYVDAEPLVKGRQKVASCYCITEKGIDVLIEHGKGKKFRRAWNNRVEGKKLQYVVEANQIFITLKNSPWKVYNSMDWKQINGLDRNTMIRFGAVRADGKRYSIYTVGEEIRDKTIERMKQEIEKHDIPVIVLFRGQDKEATIEMYQRLREGLDVEGKQEMCLMPFGAGVKIMQRFWAEREFAELFSAYGECRQYVGTLLFAGYLLFNGHQEYYVCNHLFGNEMAIYWLKKYRQDRYRAEGRKVKLFTWTSYQGIMEEEFREYPHVEIVGIDTKILTTEKIPSKV